MYNAIFSKFDLGIWGHKKNPSVPSVHFWNVLLYLLKILVYEIYVIICFYPHYFRFYTVSQLFFAIEFVNCLKTCEWRMTSLNSPVCLLITSNVLYYLQIPVIMVGHKPQINVCIGIGEQISNVWSDSRDVHKPKMQIWVQICSVSRIVYYLFSSLKVTCVSLMDAEWAPPIGQKVLVSKPGSTFSTLPPLSLLGAIKFKIGPHYSFWVHIM